jgi:hypothetical protein
MISSLRIIILDRRGVYPDPVMPNSVTYSLLEPYEIVRGHRVGFGYDRNEIDTRAETFHDLDVQGFETVNGRA